MTPDPSQATVDNRTANPRRPSQPEERLFWWLAPFLYTAFAIITPPFQTPDEQQHLFRAWQLSQGVILGERKGSRVGGVLPASLSEAAAKEIGTAEPHEKNRPKPVRSWAALPSTPSDESRAVFTHFPGTAVYSPTGYGPQVVGVWIGKALGLTVENIVRTGRLLNAALTFILLAFAIRLTAVGKRVILAIGLLPMTAACASSLGQDGLVIGGTCLLLALGTRQFLYRPWSRRQLGVVAILTLTTTLTKPVYLPLALFGFGPSRLLGPGTRTSWRPILIVAVAIVAFGLWHRVTATITVPLVTDVPPLVDRTAELVKHPRIFVGMVGQTLELQPLWILGTLASFGWMNVGPVLWAVVTLLMLPLILMLSGEPSQAQFRASARLWLFLLGLLSALLIFLVAWLLWTPRGSPIISGLQGRYFIPPLVALLIATIPRHAPVPRAWLTLPVLQLVANLAVLQAIATTYYR